MRINVFQLGRLDQPDCEPAKSASLPPRTQARMAHSALLLSISIEPSDGNGLSRGRRVFAMLPSPHVTCDAASAPALWDRASRIDRQAARDGENEFHARGQAGMVELDAEPPELLLRHTPRPGVIAMGRKAAGASFSDDASAAINSRSSTSNSLSSGWIAS
ncbi:hypothetical protein [Jannaschia seohaensis]|uniref:hypothetical protein n=1 Tax=Jannaschia seohaensis TaxID=475081 RepID=UPI001FE46F8F|nr:hypothetical protein [Jannaschia seohaensis]